MLEAIALNTSAELDASFAALVRSRPDALLIHPTPISTAHASEIAAFAREHRLPTFSWNSGAIYDGILMAYGADRMEFFNRAAVLVDKVLRGGKPADIPVEQPTKFSLSINRKTAEAIRVEIRPSLLARADEVIE